MIYDETILKTQTKKMYKLITGIPITEIALLKINMIGIFNKHNKIIANTINFCWCLFFIKY